MKRMKLSILLFAGALIFNSCAQTIPYTSNVQKKYKLTESDLKKIQFYTSDDIILHASKNDGRTKTEKGELVVTNDKSTDKVIIRAGTPGQVTDMIGNDKILVSFESGEGKSLLFGSTGRHGEFKLLAETWKNKRGKLKYDGKMYQTEQGDGETMLMFKFKKLNQTKKEERIASGRTIN
jgi:hypothetical protein